MVNVLALTLGDYQTNTYLVHDSSVKTCVVIDPGYEPEVILEKAKALGLTIEAVLLTHGHFDHVGGVEKIVEETHCALWMHRADWEKAPAPINSYLYPLANDDFTDISFCAEGDTIQAAGVTFAVLETPGHTEGSVCYRCDGAIFTGDTLFAGSCGRTDLPGGDPKAMRASLQRLAALTGDAHIFPGHGGATTLSQEKMSNPYL